LTLEKWRGRGTLPNGFFRVNDYLEAARDDFRRREEPLKSRFDPAPFRKGLAKRALERKERISDRYARAKTFLPELVDSFRMIDPEIKKIVLFGSLAKSVPRREDFDIDVAVRSEKYFSLVAWALKQEWKIDVVDLDELEGTSLDEIESRGITLYEKKRR
jgi:predicted nucleotidyltransferase